MLRFLEFEHSNRELGDLPREWKDNLEAYMAHAVHLAHANYVPLQLTTYFTDFESPSAI